MKEELFKLMSKWKFWISFQFLLVFILNIIGHIRESNPLNQIFITRLGETIFSFVISVLAFPSGIYVLFVVPPRAYLAGENGVMVMKTGVIYYLIFILLVWYITKQKRNWKLIAIGLILFMLLSFVGCSTVIEIPLFVT